METGARVLKNDELAKEFYMMSHQSGELNQLIGTNPKCRDSYVYIEDETDTGPYKFLKDSQLMPIVDKDLQKKFYDE